MMRWISLFFWAFLVVFSALIEGGLTISNGVESDGVSLNQSLHHTQSKEG